MSLKALERHLQPLTPFLQRDGVTEVCINRPKEVFVEQAGTFVRHEVDELGYPFLETLAGLIAELNDKDFPVPILSGTLPGKERIQIVMNPGCESQKLVCSIRRQQVRDLSLEDYEENGCFDDVSSGRPQGEADQVLKALYEQGQTLAFIRQAILARKNILISGGTGTGKTTFLNACLKVIPQQERIITVEDTREVKADQPNAAHLLFNEDDQRVTALQMFKACLRLRPDRIFLSELRGAEVWPYLRAANSGHPGSLSTVHADSPEGAITQLVFMMQQAGSTSDEEQIRRYVESIVHVVVQLERDPVRFVKIKEVWFGEK